MNKCKAIPARFTAATITILLWALTATSPLQAQENREDTWYAGLGLGVAGHLKHWTFRLQWERIDPDTEHDLNGVKVSAPEMDTYGLSVIYRF